MLVQLTERRVMRIDGVDRYIIERGSDMIVQGSCKIVRALDNKYSAKVILKIGNAEDVARERDYFPPTSYLSIQPFTQDLYNYVTVNGPMNLSQACEVAGTILTVLSVVHTKRVIHRDIKPQNIVCSPNGKGTGKLAVIDWGIAAYQRVGQSILYVGTPAFMSVSCLSGPHFLDDVESLMYLIEFLREADLPWGWPSVPQDRSFKDLMEEKNSWSPQEPPLQEFLAYARDRRSVDLPDYEYLKALLKESARSEHT